MQHATPRRIEGFASAALAESIRGVSQRWQRRTGAAFLGIGRRKRQGKLADEWCVKFYVTRKVKHPAKTRSVPKSITLSITSGRQRHRIRLATDVVAVGDLKVRCAPLAYIYNENSPAEQGAATAVVEKTPGGNRFLLAAGHVAARNLVVANASPCEQILKLGGEVIGALSFAPDLAATSVDAALVTLLTAPFAEFLRRVGDQPVTTICPIDEVHASPAADYTMLSWFTARPMCFEGLATDTPVKYAVGTVTFPLLLHFDCAAMGGDSGSLVVDEENRAVGMHILGKAGSESFCLPIEKVLEACAQGGSLQIVY
jgi:hypothetical protein